MDGLAFARDLAASADHGEGRAVVAQWGRNRFSGLVSGVVRDTVMAQVQIQAGQQGMLAVAAVKATNVSVEVPKTS